MLLLGVLLVLFGLALGWVLKVAHLDYVSMKKRELEIAEKLAKEAKVMPNIPRTDPNNPIVRSRDFGQGLMNSLSDYVYDQKGKN